MIGVPDERLGEAPKAFVVKKPGHQVDLFYTFNQFWPSGGFQQSLFHFLQIIKTLPISTQHNPFQVTEEDIQAYMADRLAR